LFDTLGALHAGAAKLQTIPIDFGLYLLTMGWMDCNEYF